MKIIKQFYTINSSFNKVWDALVNPKTIDAWGGGPAKMSDEENFEFSLWGGEIFGKNIEVVKNKKLVQDWYGGKWDKPSTLTFILKGNKNKTTVELVQEGVPENEIDDIEEGWKNYYMIPLKEFVEKNNS